MSPCKKNRDSNDYKKLYVAKPAFSLNISYLHTVFLLSACLTLKPPKYLLIYFVFLNKLPERQAVNAIPILDVFSNIDIHKAILLFAIVLIAAFFL